MKKMKNLLISTFAVALVLCAVPFLSQNVSATETYYDNEGNEITAYQHAEMMAQQYTDTWCSWYQGIFECGDILDAEDDFYVSVPGDVNDYPFLAGHNENEEFLLSIGGDNFIKGSYYKHVDGEGLYVAFPLLLFEGTDNTNTLNVSNVTPLLGEDESYLRLQGQGNSYTATHDPNWNALTRTPKSGVKTNNLTQLHSTELGSNNHLIHVA